MGVPWILDTPELEEAFRRDWSVYRLTLREMAAMYGFRNVNSVTRAARRLGLEKRPGGRLGRTEAALTGGRWVLDPARRVQVWQEGHWVQAPDGALLWEAA